MKSKICEILGIKYPIIQGGMVHIATPELAAAVSNAGGLGQITCTTGNRDTDTLRRNIDRMRNLTDKPFGVNIPLMMANAEDFIKTAVEEQVPLVVTSAGNPAKYTSYIKEHGIKVCHVVPSVRLGKKAEDAGVDFIVAEGWEAGGHNAYDDVTTMTLIPQIVKAVNIPVVAAGGIADARGFVAALVLGADGVQMGTRFALTTECIAHENYKKAVMAAPDNGTVVTGRFYGPTRILKGKLAEDILAWEKQGLPGEEILAKIGSGRSFKALISGDLDEGSPMAGQIGGMIDSIVSVQEVIESIVREAGEILARVKDFLG